MARPPRPAAALALLAVILAFHLAVAWQDFGTLARNGFLYDDSFYAFQIARNIADGRGMTFDGDHPTTGFQPLYVFLLVPVFLASGGDPVMPIYVALTILALCTTATAWFLFAIARRYTGRRAALAAAAIWAFSPVVTRQTANGLETGLAALMIALSAWYYIDRVRPADRPPPGRFFVLGLLLGITVLSRIDGLFLVLAVLLDQLLLMRRRNTGMAAVGRLGLVPLGVVICYGPWLALNMVQTGSPLQDSGAATRFLSLAYSTYFHYGSTDLSTTGPDLPFLGAHLIHSISTLKSVPPVHVLYRVSEKIGILLGAGGAVRLVTDVAGGLLLAAAGMSILRWRRDPSRSLRRELDFLLLFFLLLLLSYSFYIFGSFFYFRYYYPLYLGACIYLAFFLEDVAAAIRRRKLFVRRLALVGAGAYLAMFAWFSYSQAFRSHPIYPFYDIASWIEKNTGEDETIGVFQCGMIGYFADRRIVNLDGKVNRDAYAALRRGNLDRYLRREGIDVVIDHKQIIEIFLGSEAGSSRTPYISIPRGSLPHPSGWVAYRMPRDADAGGTGGGTVSNDASDFSPAR